MISMFTDDKNLIRMVEGYLSFAPRSLKCSSLLEVGFYVTAQKPEGISQGAGVISFSDTCAIDIKKKAIWTWGIRAELWGKAFDHNDVLIRPLAFLLSSYGYYSVHGSLAQRSGTSIIFSGPGGSGKSTLGCVLALNGFTLLCDDMMFISKTKSGCRLIPLKTHVKIDNGHRKEFIDLRNIKLGEVSSSQRTRKLCFIFPRYHLSAKPELRPILRKEGVSRLISDNLVLETGHPDKRAGQVSQLDFICNLGDRAPFFELKYNDKNLADSAALIAKVVLGSTL